MVVGVVHGAFSVYWALGGDGLRSTLGRSVNAAFSGSRRWILLPVAVIKIGFAVLPLGLAVAGWPARRAARLICWVGALVLVIWGGANTLTGNLVLSGLVVASTGYDRDGMVGHAWLWDPMFLLWGGSLIIGLIVTRSR